MSRPGFLLQVAITSHYTLGSNSLSKIQLYYVIFENRLEKMTSPEFAVSAAPPGRIILIYSVTTVTKYISYITKGTCQPSGSLQRVRRVMSITTNVNSALGFQ